MNYLRVWATVFVTVALYAERNPFHFNTTQAPEIFLAEKPQPQVPVSAAEPEKSWHIIQENNTVLVMQDKYGNIRVVTKANS